MTPAVELSCNECGWIFIKDDLRHHPDIECPACNCPNVFRLADGRVVKTIEEIGDKQP